MRWNPDELVLDGAPFGGPSASSMPTPRGADQELAHQQALDEAFAQGLDAGREAGAATERDRLATALAAAHTLLAQLQEREARWTERMEENVSALAVAVGRQLFDAELQAAPAHAGPLVRRALAEFPIDQPVTIRVNPSDLASITASVVIDGSHPTSGRPDAQWVPDPRIAAGGCVVEGRDRIVDGRVDTALERLYRRLASIGA